MRTRLRCLRILPLSLAAVAASTAIAVNASAGGYLDAIHNTELTTTTKGITFVKFNCGAAAYATRDPLRKPVRITKSATFSGKIPMTATTTAADGTTKTKAVQVKIKGFFGGIGAPANGTLKTATCNHGKALKFAAYPVNI